MTTISAPDPKRLVLVFKLPNQSSSSSSSSSSSTSTRTAESQLLPRWSRKRKRTGVGSGDKDDDMEAEAAAAGGLLMLASGAASSNADDKNHSRRGRPFSPKSSNAVSTPASSSSANGPTVEERLQSRIDRVLGGDGPVLKKHKAAAEAPPALKKRYMWEVCNMALASTQLQLQSQSQSLAGTHSHRWRRTQHCSSTKVLPFDLNDLPAVS